ncbi:hypothetical protein J7L48_03755 [bacterium]|nr:hypothetical protein [bacterium]
MFYKKSPLGTLNLHLGKVSDFDFKNILIKAKGTYEKGIVKIYFSKIPIFKELTFRFDTNKNTGNIVSEKLSCRLKKGDNDILFYSEDIDISLSKEHILINKFNVMNLNIIGKAELKKKIFIGSIKRNGNILLNVQGNEELLKILSLNGDEIFSLSKNGKIAGDLSLSNIINSPFDFHLSLKGNIKRAVFLDFDTITYGDCQIDRLHGTLENDHINLTNPAKNIEITGEFSSLKLDLSINNYSITPLTEYISKLLKIPLDSGILSTLELKMNGINNIKSIFCFEQLSNKYIKDLIINGRFGNNEINLEFSKDLLQGTGNIKNDRVNIQANGEYIYGKLSYAGNFKFQHSKGLNRLIFSKNSLIGIDKYKFPIQGEINIENKEIKFIELSFLNGVFNGSIQKNKNSYIEAKIAPAALNKYFTEKILCRLGFRNNHFFTQLNSNDLSGSLFLKDHGIYFENIRINYKNNSIYFYGNGNFSSFLGYLEFERKDLSLDANLFFQPKKEKGTIIFDHIKFHNSEFKNGVLNFTKNGKRFNGWISNNLILNGKIENRTVSLDSEFKDLNISGYFSKNLDLNGDMRIKYRDSENINISGTIGGYVENIEGINIKGNQNFDAIFNYDQKVISFDFLHIYSSIMDISGKGYYKNRNDLHLDVSHFFYNGNGKFIKGTVNLQKYKKKTFLEIKDLEGTIGENFTCKYLKFDTLKGKELKIKGLNIEKIISLNEANAKINGNEFKGNFIGYSQLGNNYDTGQCSGSINSNKFKVKLIASDKEILNGKILKSKNSVIISHLNFLDDSGSISIKGEMADELEFTLNLNGYSFSYAKGKTHALIKPFGNIDIKGYFNRPEVYFDIKKIIGNINKLKFGNSFLWGYLNKNFLEIFSGNIKVGNSEVAIKNNTRIILNNNVRNRGLTFDIKGLFMAKDIKKIFPNIIRNSHGSIYLDVTYDENAHTPLTGVISGDFRGKLNYFFNGIKFDNLSIELKKDGSITKKGDLYIDKKLIPMDIIDSGPGISLSFYEPTHIFIPQIGMSGDILGKIAFVFDSGLKISSKKITIENGLLTYDPLISNGENNNYTPVFLDLFIDFKEAKYSTSFYDGFVWGNMKLSGNISNLDLIGNVNSHNSVLTVLGNNFTVESGKVNFKEKAVYINVISSKNFIWNENVKVFLNLLGNVKDLKMSMNSIPQMDEKILKNKVFKGSLSSGIDLLLSRLLNKKKFVPTFTKRFTDITHLTNIKLDIRSPMLMNSKTNEISLNFKTYIKRLTLQSSLAIKKEEVFEFIPTFNLGLRYNESIYINLLIGGEDKGIMLGPTFYF